MARARFTSFHVAGCRARENSDLIVTATASQPTINISHNLSNHNDVKPYLRTRDCRSKEVWALPRGIWTIS